GVVRGGVPGGGLEARAERGPLIGARVSRAKPEDPARLQMARALARGRGPIAPGSVHQPDHRRCGRIVPRGGCGLWHFHRSACFLTSHTCTVWRAVWGDSPASEWPRNTARCAGRRPAEWARAEMGWAIPPVALPTGTVPYSHARGPRCHGATPARSE